VIGGPSVRARRLRILVGLGTLLAAAGAFAQDPAAGPPKPRIGRITIQALDVFSPSEAARGWVYRTANAVRFETHPSVIRKFLLFREGDVYDPVRLVETERNLRKLPFLKSAAVAASAEHDGLVDVAVVTQDAWTTEPGISIGGKGGVTTYGFTLREKDFLGTGRLVSLAYDKGTERTTTTLEYVDPYIFGPYWTADLAYSDNSDGHEEQLSIARPFVSFTDPRSRELSIDHVTQNDRIFEDGDTLARFRQRHFEGLARYGWAVEATDARARRLFVGVDVAEDRFELLPNSPSEVRPGDRKFRYVTGEYDSEENDFLKVNYVNRDSRFEDFNLGRVYNAELGVSPEAFGSPKTTLRLRLSGGEGWRLTDQSFVMAQLAYQTRWDGAPANQILSGRLLYVLKLPMLVPMQTFVSHVVVDWGWNVDRDVQFYADPDNGLRGYKLHAFAGDRRVVFNAEQRFFVGKEILQLFSPGAAVFFDTGYASPPGRPMTFSEFKSDVGVGLRIAITRAATNSILRLDLAYPLNADAHGRRGLLVTFSSGQVF
jgi:hypothetical protein